MVLTRVNIFGGMVLAETPQLSWSEPTPGDVSLSGWKDSRCEDPWKREGRAACRCGQPDGRQ